MNERRPKFQQIANNLKTSILKAKFSWCFGETRRRNERFYHHVGMLSYVRSKNNEEDLYFKSLITGFESNTGNSVVGKLPDLVKFDTELTSQLMKTSGWNNVGRHVAKHYSGGTYGQETFLKPFGWERRAWDDIAAFLLVNCQGAVARMLGVISPHAKNSARGIAYYSGIRDSLNRMQIIPNVSENYATVPLLTILLAGLLFEISCLKTPPAASAKGLLDSLFSFYLLAPKDNKAQLVFAVQLNRDFLQQQKTASGRQITFGTPTAFPAVGIELGMTGRLPFFSEQEARANKGYCLHLSEPKFTTAFFRSESCEAEWNSRMTATGATDSPRRGFISKMSFLPLEHVVDNLPYFR